MTTTISALYDTHADATAAVRELEAAGIPHSDISLVSNNNSSSYEEEVAKDAGTGAGIGAALGGAGGLLAGLGMVAIPGVGPVVAAGWLVATAAGAVAGAAAGGVAGGLVGALTEAGTPTEEAHFYAEGVRRGGTLVTARVKSDSSISQVRSILHRHSYVNPDSRMQAYQEDGWTAFDAKSQPFTHDEIVRERNRYTTRQ